MLIGGPKLLRQVVALLETSNLLFLKLCLRKPGAARLFPGRVFREYVSLAGRNRWLSRDIFELFPETRAARFTVEHIEPCGLSMGLEELAYVAMIARLLAPSRVFEIGTFRGRTTLNLALNSPPTCCVFTLDLPPQGRELVSAKACRADRSGIARSLTGVDYRGKEGSEKIVQLYGDSRTFDFTPYYAQMDLVVVDGSKSYPFAKSDTENALKMVKPGGVIVWHGFANYGDYNDVTRAILDTIPADRVFQIANTELALYKNEAATAES